MGRVFGPNLEYPWTLDQKEETYLNNVADQLLKHRDR